MTDQPTTYVEGYCPMCGGESLFVGVVDHITCARLDCPRPSAADEILADRETEHLVEFQDDGTFTVRHPLRERLDDDLFTCDLHAHIANSPGRGSAHVRYRVIRDLDTGGWVWEIARGDRRGADRGA